MASRSRRHRRPVPLRTPVVSAQFHGRGLVGKGGRDGEKEIREREERRGEEVACGVGDEDTGGDKEERE